MLKQGEARVRRAERAERQAGGKGEIGQKRRARVRAKEARAEKEFEWEGREEESYVY
jgi:hypothetical protein